MFTYVYYKYTQQILKTVCTDHIKKHIGTLPPNKKDIIKIRKGLQ